MGISCSVSRAGAAPSAWLGHGTRRARAGFTLVEILVVIVIVGILVAIVVAAVGGARRNARQTESLAINRQIAAVLGHYAGDYRDHFPAYENRGPDAGGPVTIAGRAVMVSVMSAHMKLWPAAVANHDPAALVGLRHPRVQGAMFDGTSPTIEQTFFWLTPAVAVLPEAFTVNPPRPVPLSMLGAQRWSDVSFPSQKGIVLDVVWPDIPDVYLASFGDGSAAAIPVDRSVVVAPLPGTGPHVPVISTLDGLRGRDR
jgi:prepilin-type N-terminal cleavage/methylation domain-containing protein